MKNYTKNHQKSKNFNAFMLTSAIFRGFRSVFFKTSFSLYQKYIREFVFKKLLRHLFLFKNYSIFPRDRLWRPPLPPRYHNFSPPPPSPPQDSVKPFSAFSILSKSNLSTFINIWFQQYSRVERGKSGGQNGPPTNFFPVTSTKER